MLRNVLLIAALLAMSEAAVLVRFINTVPTRSTVDSLYSATTPTNGPVAPSDIETRVDRVGLQYYSDTVATPTIVWTTLVPTTAASTGYTAGNPFFYAMPPLRAYHSTRTGGWASLTTAGTEAAAADRPFGQTDNTAELYETSRLFADGVGLYLTFAAGTYRMQAYGVIATLTNPSAAAGVVASQAATARGFTDSSVSLTFADNKVYTIVAYGVGQFGATTPLSGNTVRLTMIEESIAPVTFGMAAVRFFNGFGSQTSSVDVYNGATASDATRIATAITVGTVSSYVDVLPGLTREFPVLVSGSTSNFLATNINVQRDLRAGSRQTIFCGITSEAANVGYCRGIPSRVVAYVRLVSDLVGQDSYVQGKVGAQKLSLTNLNLYASYEAPRPEQTQDQSQVIGTPVYTGHPATTIGLYPVVVNVAPQTVSGYGEVFVPVYIMDYAVRPVIATTYGSTRASTTYNGADAATNGNANSIQDYVFSAAFKRVHFLLKTDGMATLSGKWNNINVDDGAAAAVGTDASIYPFVNVNQVGLDVKTGTADTRFTAVNNNYEGFANTVTLDRSVQPGEYYTLIASAIEAATATTPATLQVGTAFRIYMRRDRSLTQVNTGFTTGKGVLAVSAFGNQALATATMTILPTTPNPVSDTLTAAAGTARTRTLDGTLAGTLQAPLTSDDTTDTEKSLTEGTYTYSVAGFAACTTSIPSGTPASFTITANKVTDLFVLGAYACRNQGNSAARLTTVIQTRAPATETGHSPFTTTTTRSQRHSSA